MNKLENEHSQILEDVYLNVLSERSVGKITLRSYQDLEKEIFKRLRISFNDEEIAKLISSLGHIGKTNFASYDEILTGLIEHTKNVFIPATNQIRTTLNNSLSLKEKEVLLLGRQQYLTRLDQYISNQKDRILKNVAILDKGRNKKLRVLDLTKELYRLIPMFEGDQNMNMEWYLNFLEIAKKYKGVLDEFLEEHLDLLQERYKIRLGKLGNILTTTMAIGVDNKLSTENKIIELLFIS